jgi:predicted AAA+ superfamily ATPase
VSLQIVVEKCHMTRRYLPRIADKVLCQALTASGAVCIQGPKWCGKTWTATQQAKSMLMMQDPDQAGNYMSMAEAKPSLLLEGEVPRLLDEWQTAPVLWDAVRFAVDKRGEMGQFILTGSTKPLESDVMHSGTGRISRMRMRTMSLSESGDSNGRVSLSQLFAGEEPEGCSELDIEELAFVLARGGWPASIGAADDAALQQARNYLDAIVETDVSEVDGRSRNPARVRALMKSIARNVASSASVATIRSDIAGDDESLSPNTIRAYLTALERLFVIEDQPAWTPALRSKTALRTSAKRHFVDPSIAVAALQTSPAGLLKDFKTFGFLFESLCIRDLRVYAQILGGNVFHYRDQTDLEADAIVALHDGRWGAVEIKMAQAKVEQAAANLLRLKNRVDEEKMHPPAFLMVLTGNGYAMRRRDGVLVVPVGCLKA